MLEVVTTKTPKDEAEEVMNALLPIAREALSRYGAFIPFGAVMRANGSIVPMRSEGGGEQPPEQAMQRLNAAFLAGAEAKEYRATGLAMHVRTPLPGETQPTDAVAVQLDHAGGFSAVVVFPYQRSAAHEVSFGVPFARPTKGAIF